MSDYSGRHQQRHHKRLKAHNRLEVPTRDYQLPEAIGSWSPFDVTEYVRSLFANDPTMLPASMRLSRLSLPPGGLDAVIDGSQVDPTTFPFTDGIAPASSPTPTVSPGIGSLFVKWTAITNADAVGYEVHVSTTTGFTPDATTLSQKIVGTLATIRKMPDGTALSYTTTYYVKLVAFDDDGSAAAGAQGSASPDQVNTADIAVNAITADTILANAITAEKLDTTIVMSTTIIAGTDGGARVQLGVDPVDHDIVGLQAYNSSDTLTFNLNGQDGSVYVKGRVDWGTTSRLLSNDIMELGVQASTGFQTPARVQTANISQSNFGGSDFSSLSCTWPSPTTKGNLLLAVVTQLNSGGGTAPTTPTIAAWTQIQTATRGTGPIIRQTMFKIENAASRSGSQSISLGSNTRYAAVTFYEYSGVDTVDIVATAGADTNTTAASTATGVLTQAGELLFGAISAENEMASSLDAPFSLADSAAARHDHTIGGVIQSVVDAGQVAGELITTSTTSQAISATLAASERWVAQLATFKAKAVGITNVSTPDASKVSLFAYDDTAGTATPHTISETGVANSLVMGPSVAGWRMEYVTQTINWPNTAAHTAATSQTPSISGLLVGDLCFIIGYTNPGAPIPRAFIATTEGVCTTNGQIAVQGFNADSAAVDPTITTYHFLVIHRT